MRRPDFRSKLLAFYEDRIVECDGGIREVHAANARRFINLASRYSERNENAAKLSARLRL